MAWGDDGTWGGSGVWGSPTFGASWDPSGLANGTYVVTIIALDASDNENSALYGPINVTVNVPQDLPPPPPPPSADPFAIPARTERRGLALSSIREGDVLSGVARIVAVRSGDDWAPRILHADLYLDGAKYSDLVPAFDQYSLELDTTTLTNGVHTLGLGTVNALRKSVVVPVLLTCEVQN